MDDSGQRDSENRPPFSNPPVSVRRIRETELERRAAQVGAVAGHTYAALRDARKILEEPGHGSAKDRLLEFSATAKSRTQNLRREAAAIVEEWRQAALDKTAELRSQARRRYEEARARAKQAGDDYPLHLVFGAGIAGFLIGAALRRRRSHRGR